jgi:uncharacterized protein YdhG (YjbR/CyaY superfamily)
MKTKPATIDEYIAAFPDHEQEILQKIRQTIHKTVPEASETISYGGPCFNLNGSYLVYFAGYKNHVSIYPTPSDPSLSKDLEAFRRGAGTLRFPLEQPVPYDLVARVVKALVQDNLARVSKR